ncbi:ABC transporter ATP-binding protein [Salinithrix halophila]|uniref:ABC transporter ATP-binding protein n=1 Tax=Salinithrix halophila TaxID=1485204 RepID=A0ABV8JA82_9BACL
MDEALDVKNLQKSYGENPALKGITFSVRPGVCFGLLGPNGAGKSTMMKVLTGIVDADGGSASILGKEMVRDRQAIREQVGYVPQSITLAEKLSAWDNLAFFGEMYRVKGKRLKQRIEEVLTQTGLLDRARDPVDTFSGGMKRRINIAAALLHRPKLLILDEPTVGIDPQSRNHIFEMIRSLKEEGVTIIYSTHYMEEVEALCDEIAIIDHGEIIAQGDWRELLGRHSQPAIYVEAEGFSDSPPLEGEWKSHRKGKGWIIETDRPTVAMQQVLEIVARRKVKIDALEMMHPSLETVFLSLTGTQLRD